MYLQFTYQIFITAKANPFEDAKVEEQEEMLEPEGKEFFFFNNT